MQRPVQDRRTSQALLSGLDHGVEERGRCAHYLPGAIRGFQTAVSAGGKREGTIFLSRARPLLEDALPMF